MPTYPDLSKLSGIYSTLVIGKAEKLLQHNAVCRDVFHVSVFHVRGSQGNQYRVQVIDPFDEDQTIDIGPDPETLPYVTCTCPNGMATGGRARCYHAAAVVGLLLDEQDDIA
jgi:hypothetical protein